MERNEVRLGKLSMVRMEERSPLVRILDSGSNVQSGGYPRVRDVHEMKALMTWVDAEMQIRKVRRVEMVGREDGGSFLDSFRAVIVEARFRPGFLEME